MTPVTTQRRALRRTDTRRRPATTRPAASIPTLFDAAPPVLPAPAPSPEADAVVAAPTAPEADAVVASPAAPAAPMEPGAREIPAAPAALAGSGETLDRLVVGSWERLATRADIPCLLCGGTMEPAYGAHAIPIGGRCRDCGTTLS